MACLRWSSTTLIAPHLRLPQRTERSSHATCGFSQPLIVKCSRDGIKKRVPRPTVQDMKLRSERVLLRTDDEDTQKNLNLKDQPDATWQDDIHASTVQSPAVVPVWRKKRGRDKPVAGPDRLAVPNIVSEDPQPASTRTGGPQLNETPPEPGEHRKAHRQAESPPKSREKLSPGKEAQLRESIVWSKEESLEVLQQVLKVPRVAGGGSYLLVEPEVAHLMAAEVGQQDGVAVLEAGSGIGTLTAALLKRGCHVVATEEDPALADTAISRFAEQLHYKLYTSLPSSWTSQLILETVASCQKHIEHKEDTPSAVNCQVLHLPCVLENANKSALPHSAQRPLAPETNSGGIADLVAHKFKNPSRARAVLNLPAKDNLRLLRKLLPTGAVISQLAVILPAKYVRAFVGQAPAAAADRRFQLSVHFFAEVDTFQTLPRSAFYPDPLDDLVLVNLSLKEPHKWPRVRSLTAFFAMLDALFQEDSSLCALRVALRRLSGGRNWTSRNVLSPLRESTSSFSGLQDVAEWQMLERLRPVDLTLNDLVALFQRLTEDGVLLHSSRRAPQEEKAQETKRKRPQLGRFRDRGA